MERQEQKLCEETMCPAQGTAKRPVWLEQNEEERMCKGVRWEKWAEQVIRGLIGHGKTFEMHTTCDEATGSLGRERGHVCIYV